MDLSRLKALKRGIERNEKRLAEQREERDAIMLDLWSLELGPSQIEIADAAGVSSAYIRKLAAGARSE